MNAVFIILIYLQVMLTINEQVHDYDCFSNATDSSCHRGVVIYVKKYLNATSFYISQKRLKEYSFCKMVIFSILYIVWVFRSPNSALDKNDILNQAIEDVSKLKSELITV